MGIIHLLFLLIFFIKIENNWISFEYKSVVKKWTRANLILSNTKVRWSFAPGPNAIHVIVHIFVLGGLETLFISKITGQDHLFFASRRSINIFYQIWWQKIMALENKHSPPPPPPKLNDKEDCLLRDYHCHASMDSIAFYRLANP